MGVLLFFILSGFVIAMAAVQRPRGWREFLIGRIGRIYPAYLATTGLVILALVISPAGALNHAPDISWQRLLRTLCFDFGQMGGYVYVGWTLFYELCFYLAFSLVVNRFDVIHRTGWFKTLLIAGLLICSGLGLARSGSFLMGVALFQLMDESRPREKHDWMALLAAVLAFGWRSPESLICATLLVTLVLLEDRWHVNFAVAPFLQLGDASYSIYLVQVLTISGSLKLAKSLNGGTDGLYGLWAMGLGLLSTVLAGLALRRWVERPGTRISLRWGKRLLGSTKR